MTTFYNFSGGMESAAMLVIDRDRIRTMNAVVCFADTGKHFPEMAASIAQVESQLGLKVTVAERRISFDEFLFERGGMIRKGTTDCSRRMKRSNLSRLRQQYPKPWEINLGFNAGEFDRASEFTAANERDWCHWRYPLIEAGVERADTWDICRKAGLSIIVGMYEKMGRFDCFWCGNQTPRQALKVVDNYPELAAEWLAAEAKKGHGFMPRPLKMLIEDREEEEGRGLFAGCSCFGGSESAFEPEEDRGPRLMSISDSYDGPADPCPLCNPNGIPSGHADSCCNRCAGTYWLPDGNCFACGQPADGYYQGRSQFPTCGGRKCEMKMQGGIDAHEKGCNR